MNSSLWHKFLAGDDLAFSLIYKEFFQQLYTYGLKLGFNEEACKDAIHDVFYTIFTTREKLMHVKNIEFYLFHSCKNRLMDLYHREKSTANLNYDIMILDKEELIIEQIIKNEKEEQMKETVNRLLQKLTSKQKKVIHYRYALNLKYSEIAIIMGITPDAVKKIIQRAMKVMREETGDTPEHILFILIIFLLS